ncbi:hypothetical protein ABPG75_012164 [Micractinium tetrahymenae]
MNSGGTSGSPVTTWTSLCTSLYAGFGVRTGRSQTLKYGDGVLGVACKEAYNLAHAAACKASGATNPFSSAATCTALLNAVVAQLNRFLASLPADQQAGVMPNMPNS